MGLVLEEFEGDSKRGSIISKVGRIIRSGSFMGIV